MAGQRGRGGRRRDRLYSTAEIQVPGRGGRAVIVPEDSLGLARIADAPAIADLSRTLIEAGLPTTDFSRKSDTVLTSFEQSGVTPHTYGERSA